MRKLFLTLGIIGLLTFGLQAQEKTNEGLKSKESKSAFVKIKDGAKPDVYIDGKKYDSEILNLIDVDKIESISIYKGEEAMKKYNAPEVIVIKSKMSKNNKQVKVDVVKQSSPENNILISGSKDKTGMENAVIVIDGEIVSNNDLKKLSPNEIDRINVLKDEKSLKKYNTEVGVILVTTKNKKD